MESIESPEAIPSERGTSKVERTQEEGNAVGLILEENTCTESDWDGIIERNFAENFSGNKKAAARLMHELCIGALYVRKSFQDRGLDVGNPPAIAIIKRDEDAPGVAGQIPGCIYVKKSLLELVSEGELDDIRTISRGSDEVEMFKGTSTEFFRLLGVEECHHNVFTHYKLGLEHVDPDSLTIAEYDSSDIEFNALRWQLRHAREVKMRNIVIANLEERVENARQERIKRVKDSSANEGE